MTGDSTPPNPLRIVVADDHAIVRAGLVRLFEADSRFDVVGEAQSGEEALLRCLEQRPHLLLIDLMMPGMGGQAAISTIRQHHPQVAIVVLSAIERPELMQALAVSGVAACLHKSVLPAELKDVLSRVGHAHLGSDHSELQTLAPHAGARAGTGGDGDLCEASVLKDLLTRRQLEILEWLRNGLSNKEIAREMGISEFTVRGHVQQLYKALNVKSRTQAVFFAQKAGLF